MAASVPNGRLAYAAASHRSGEEAYLLGNKRGLLSTAILLLFRATQRAGFHAR
jgi:hypothetical protein